MSAKKTPSVSKRAEVKEDWTPRSPKSPIDENGIHHLVNEQSSRDIWMLLLAFRFINALCVRTFFQPDEYFQSLEPAWQMAFGSESGAWITWEWQHQLRSSLHPALFAVAYAVVDGLMKFPGLFPQFRAMILSVLPNVVQAVIAAFGDYYTWKLSEKMHGIGSNATLATLLLTVFSPWQWFCSTRTFSNCLETTMTITALYFWPWEITMAAEPPKSKIGKKAPTSTEIDTLPSFYESPQAGRKIRLSLILALTACVLRPTNLLIWFCIGIPTLKSLLSTKSRISLDDKVALLGEAINCSITVLAISAISDRLYFGFWTFPPYQWLTFNISLDLAVFYGRNDWHYFLSQGLPLLLTTYLPFALIGLWKSIRQLGMPLLFAKLAFAVVGILSFLSYVLNGQNELNYYLSTVLFPLLGFYLSYFLLRLWTSTAKLGMPFLFTITVVTTLGALSLISHKEVRFIYPLLPLLHIIAAPHIASFFYHTKSISPPPRPTSSALKEDLGAIHNKPLLTLLVILNLSIAYYTTQIHQSGVLPTMTYIRTQFEHLAFSPLGTPLPPPGKLSIPDEGTFDFTTPFVGFLTPCHSTPWRSQLFYPGLKAWALTCEPPLHIPAHTKERQEYRDEADRFYDDPLGFLEREIGTEGREWPRFIVGFEGIEKPLRQFWEGENFQKTGSRRLHEKWRVGNSQWHDDWRRVGDLVVWEIMDLESVEVFQEPYEGVCLDVNPETGDWNC